jgi:hypothetical protein
VKGYSSEIGFYGRGVAPVTDPSLVYWVRSYLGKFEKATLLPLEAAGDLMAPPKKFGCTP